MILQDAKCIIGGNQGKDTRDLFILFLTIVCKCRISSKILKTHINKNTKYFLNKFEKKDVCAYIHVYVYTPTHTHWDRGAKYQELSHYQDLEKK